MTEQLHMTDTQTIKLVFWLGALVVVLIFSRHKRDPWPIAVISAIFLALAFGDFVF